MREEIKRKNGQKDGKSENDNYENSKGILFRADKTS